jgi:hypothetical protein
LASRTYAADNLIYWEHAFGPGRLTFPDPEAPHTAAGALVSWRASREPIGAWLTIASIADLAEARPSHLGAPKTAGEVIAILIDEQIHHGAEIALLRDLSPATLTLSRPYRLSALRGRVIGTRGSTDLPLLPRSGSTGFAAGRADVPR